jgi:hypothetical protein
VKVLIGLIFILGGIAGGLYVGVWLCFIGGIVDIITAAKVANVVPIDIAIGCAKVLFAGLFGWLTGVLPILFGAALVADA